MYDYNCPDCNEAKLQSDKNARKINEVIDQVNALIQINNETVDFIEEKAEEKVEEIAEIKVNEVLGDLTTEIDKKVNKEENNVYFTPPKIYGLNSEEMGEVNTSFIYNLYDSLVDGKYVTKTILGKDQSGTLDVVKYEFTPKYYTKKIVINANIHGNGDGGDPKDVTLALYYFLEKLYKNNRENKHLNYIRNNCKLIVVPIANPWGYDNKSRYNSRGVDLCRNFPYGWELYTDTTGTRPKGDGPCSEQETIYIKNILDENYDATAYIDFHAWMNNNINFGYEFAGENNTKTLNVAYGLADYLIRKYNISQNELSVQTLTVEPTPGRYAYNTLKIPSGNPEFYVYVNDLEQRSPEMWTRMVEWYGNFIYLYSTQDIKIANGTGRNIFNFWYSYAKDNMGILINTTTTNNYEELTSLTKEITRTKVTGYAKVTYRVNIKNEGSDSSAQNFICPLVYQVGSTNFNETNYEKALTDRFESYSEGLSRTCLYAQAIIPIYKNCGDIKIGLMAKTTSGTLRVFRYDAIVELIDTFDTYVDSARENDLWINRIG